MTTLTPKIVDTPKSVAELVDELVSLHTPARRGLGSSPVIYIDLEGVNLCREGSISIITLLVDSPPAAPRVYLIDVHSLGDTAFTTAGSKKRTLKDVLQDEQTPKVFFDVRNDSDALFAHHGVALRGVEDVQLMESATRRNTSSRRYLNGLARCVKDNMLRGAHADWLKIKQAGEKSFNPERGGCYDVFNQRPIPDDIAKYCVGDVRCLPNLRKKLCDAKTPEWRTVLAGATKTRVASTHLAEYKPHGRERALASWTDEQNQTLDRINYIPSLDEWLDAYEDRCMEAQEEQNNEEYFGGYRDFEDDGVGNDFGDWTGALW